MFFGFEKNAGEKMATVPGALIWEIVKKNNSFLVKEFGNGTAKVQFSKESNNLYNAHSYKYSGSTLILLFYFLSFNFFFLGLLVFIKFMLLSYFVLLLSNE